MSPAFEHLDRRLSRHDARPVALALSGGGDSMALLLVAADWCAARGRRLLALTVDHRLHPDSGRWTGFARDAAHRVGADWRSLVWDGDKPGTGLPAAARRARHALLADAARAVGATVMLTAHTADDVAENAWMRARGSTLGELRAWSPSPVWPEGRGLMLLRPLLEQRREALRDLLRARGHGWIDDPANDDPRHPRVRARRDLAGRGLADAASSSDAPAAVDPGPLAGSGVLILEPGDRPLAQALVSASGRERPPRAEAVDRLRARVRTGAPFHATLSGAVVVFDGETVAVGREAGRRPPPPLPLKVGCVHVWDGRFELLSSGPGWTVRPAAGRLSRLSKADRAELATLPAPLRGTRPVLFREGEPRPVLASPEVSLRCLVAERFRLATGGAGAEADLVPPTWRNGARRPILRSYGRARPGREESRTE